MNTVSPKASLVKLGLYPRPKALKVMVLGQSGVGKSAMVVRFITRRYIGDYDPTLEKVYTFHTVIDSEMVCFDILDTAGQPDESECLGLEANIRWAEAFILVYSVADKCSFDECYRLKFLINYNKRRRRLGSASKDGCGDVPVVLVGNKVDLAEDRMVSLEEGQKRSREIGCVCFHEISVKESIEQVYNVFRDVCRFWRVHSKNPVKMRRSASEKDQNSPDAVKSLCSAVVSPSSLYSYKSITGSRRWADGELEEEEEESVQKESCASSPCDSVPFRERASTDGHLPHRPWRWRNPAPKSQNGDACYHSNSAKSDRRMSISMRGSNASY